MSHFFGSVTRQVNWRWLVVSPSPSGSWLWKSMHISIITHPYIILVRSSGPHPLLGESSTFRRGVRVSSSETG